MLSRKDFTAVLDEPMNPAENLVTGTTMLDVSHIS